MKVQKRDGRIVEYNADKITAAIKKANVEVDNSQKVSDDLIEEAIGNVEKTDKEVIPVETIQDIIEKTLVAHNKYVLAKKYMIYRYQRSLLRKSNTTDESILKLIRNENKELAEENSNKNTVHASTQRDYIAGEVSRDLTRRMLLPEHITMAHQNGILHFHDADYFIQPIFNCCLINIKDMLDNGTVMNGKMIESPKSFQVACTVTTQIIAAVASNQYGGQSVNVAHLGKYLRKSRDKFMAETQEKFKDTLSQEDIEKIVEMRVDDELRSGVQTIQYQINTLMTTNGQSPFVTLFLYIDENNEYVDENVRIIEEILRQRLDGIKNEQGVYVTPAFPKLIYVLDENKWEGRFNQGVVSINLPQIGLVAKGDEEKFWKLFDERLELCYEALMCRHKALEGVVSDVSPIHWQYGAIARLKKGETIDKYLHNGYSTLSLGYIGLYELTYLMTGESQTSGKGKEFALKVMYHMRDAAEKWKEETGLGFSLYGTPAETLCYRFAKIDYEKFGPIKNVTDKGYYTNSYHVDVREKINAFDKFDIESEFQNISLGGAISYVEIPNMQNNLPALETLVKYIYDNIQYGEFNTKSDYCQDCGFDGEIIINDNMEWECPQCHNKDHSKLNVTRRTCGYLGENFWNAGKTKEIKSRVLHL